MLRSEAISRIQRRLGFRTDLDTAIIEELRDSQAQLEHGGAMLPNDMRVILPWFLIRYDQTLAVTNGNASVNLPSDYIREADGHRPHYTSGSTEVHLEKALPEPARRYFPDPGAPAVYEIRVTTIYLWPTPDNNYTLTWSYHGEAADLTSDITNDWLTYAPDVLIGLAGMRLAGDLEDETAYNRFSEQFKVGAHALEADHYGRLMAGRKTQVGRAS